MAKKSLVVRGNKPAKFSSRIQNRCQKCGRSKAVLRRFKLCRVCFRTAAHHGEVPGLKKASW